MAAPKRAWVDPGGQAHALGKPGDAFATHTSWIKQNRAELPWKGGANDTMQEMSRQGWIQKHGPDVYSIHHIDDLGAVRAHVQTHHPEHLNNTVVDVEDRGDGSYRRVGLDGRHPRAKRESRADQVIEGFFKRKKAHVRAWITPNDESHDVGYGSGFSGHFNWIQSSEKVPQEHVVRFDPKPKATVGGPEVQSIKALDTQKNMISAGWIRKSNHNSYETHVDHVERVHRHVTDHHRDSFPVKLRVHDSEGKTHAGRLDQAGRFHPGGG
jgi:hypothetical protein